ncbi:RNA-binding (RRM/RBD/RNP motifs) family protein [Striga asiatica]|uniref:RNA-binding (RRM/RBD/RNP motifs) family protein n=1 Tax=Striga asiatica TaxID=4170 RepID=A0A5A7QFS3_STRAF|nr:RNA-binding (RRM/RBD/RNP motifs) family protein [Striga asiatica]
MVTIIMKRTSNFCSLSQLAANYLQLRMPLSWQMKIHGGFYREKQTRSPALIRLMLSTALHKIRNTSPNFTRMRKKYQPTRLTKETPMSDRSERVIAAPVDELRLPVPAPRPLPSSSAL